MFYLSGSIIIYYIHPYTAITNIRPTTSTTMYVVQRVYIFLNIFHQIFRMLIFECLLCIGNGNGDGNGDGE